MTHPLLTADLPGTGGRVREAPEDFIVSELPSYEPSGVGDHAFLLVEKRGVTTLEAARRIARALGVAPRSVGYAGLKDKWAVTRQTFSVEHVELLRAGRALERVPGLRLLRAELHRNKLRLGHLRGNRFELRLRGVHANAAERARAVLETLRRGGCPNYFGEQRFGVRGDNHEIGRELVRGDAGAAVARLLSPGAADEALGPARERFAAGDAHGALEVLPPGHDAERRVLAALAAGADARRALTALSRPVLRLLVSAYQSHLFNALVAERAARGLGTLEQGDLAFLHAKGAVFSVDDPAREQPRADRLELSPSAPLFGLKTLLASGAPGERERDLLRSEGITPEDFRVAAVGRFEGVRRPVRIPLGEPAVEDEGGGAIVIAFSLPAGSYATTVLREVMEPRSA